MSLVQTNKDIIEDKYILRKRIYTCLGEFHIFFFLEKKEERVLSGIRNA